MQSQADVAEGGQSQAQDPGEVHFDDEAALHDTDSPLPDATDQEFEELLAKNTAVDEDVAAGKDFELQLEEGWFAGSILSCNGKFGFIKQDTGEADMFVIPPACNAFGREVPPVGTRVKYQVVTDNVTGRVRADHVMPEDAMLEYPAPAAKGEAFAGWMGRPGAGKGNGTGTAVAPLLQDAEAQISYDDSMQTLASKLTGTVLRNNGRFGFIRQDSGEADMFMLPPFPPIGARVMYDSVTDPKTGRPRAENVEVMDVGGCNGAVGSPMALPNPKPSHVALFEEDYGAAGAARNGPYGGKPRGSYDVGPAAYPHKPMDDGSRYAGVVTSCTDKFGFIKQDSGEADMFVIPPSCDAFGRIVPPVGARVTYMVAVDGKTGRLRADQVQPE